MAQLTKRQQQGAESREQILDIAEGLMAERGVTGTSLSALTKASGLPASSIYWHFGSKDGVLVAVMERGAERFFASLAPPGSFKGSGPKRIREQLDDTARAIEEHGDFLGLLLTLILLRGEGTDGAGTVIAEVRAEARRRIDEMLIAAGSGGGSKRRRSHPLTDVVLAAIDGIFIAHLEDPATDFRARFRQLGRLIEASLD